MVERDLVSVVLPRVPPELAQMQARMAEQLLRARAERQAQPLALAEQLVALLQTKP